MLYLLVAVLVIIDQIVKLIIIRNVDLNEIIPVIANFFSITHVKNTGGAFSFLAEKDWGIYFLASMSLVISIVLLVVIYRIKGKEMFWIRMATAVLAGGSIGNMIDRFFRKSVVDFLMFDFGKYTFPVFNVADMCIVIGSFALAIFLLFDKRFMKAANDPESSGHDDEAPVGSLNESTDSNDGEK
jgi:signal peptidase II